MKTVQQVAAGTVANLRTCGLARVAAAHGIDTVILTHAPSAAGDVDRETVLTLLNPLTRRDTPAVGERPRVGRTRAGRD